MLPNTSTEVKLYKININKKQKIQQQRFNNSSQS